MSGCDSLLRSTWIRLTAAYVTLVCARLLLFDWQEYGYGALFMFLGAGALHLASVFLWFSAAIGRIRTIVNLVMAPPGSLRLIQATAGHTIFGLLAGLYIRGALIYLSYWAKAVRRFLGH